jgi:hypothetical protein
VQDDGLHRADALKPDAFAALDKKAVKLVGGGRNTRSSKPPKLWLFVR